MGSPGISDTVQDAIDSSDAGADFFDNTEEHEQFIELLKKLREQP